MCSFIYTVTYKSYYKRYVVSRLIGIKIDTFMVYSFPVTAITNNHELGGLDNVHLFSYSSVGQKSVSLARIKASAGLPSFQRLWRESISLLLQLLGAASLPWFMALSSISKASGTVSCFSGDFAFLFCVKSPPASLF